MKPGNELSNFLDETEGNNEPSQASSATELDSNRDETNRNKYEEKNETGIFQLNYFDLLKEALIGYRSISTQLSSFAQFRFITNSRIFF